MTGNIGLKLVGAAAIAAMLTALAMTATAAPSAISYSGELRADNGVLYTGEINVTAALHNTSAGDDLVWGPQDLGSIAVSQGLFQAIIGGGGVPSLDPALMENDNIWLELTIDGVALSPRQRLRSVPFARVAANAQNVAGTPANQIATLTDLDEFPVAAFSSETAPADPVMGQFWLDTSDGTVFVWSAGAWVPISAAGLDPSDLPDDGLNAVSNGTLSNQFFDVTAAWDSGPIAVPDNDAAGVTANILVEEGSQAKLYDLTVSATMELEVVSQIQVILTPPTGTGVNPIVLFDEVIAPQPGEAPLEVAFNFTLATTPEFSQLLDKLPAGQWSLTVSDDALTVVTPPLVVGALTGFQLQYDVLRSDEVGMQGDLIVFGNTTVGGNINLTGDLTSDTPIDVNVPVRDKYIMYKGFCGSSLSSGSGFQPYCLSGTEFNNAENYISVNQGNGEITISQDGVYTIRFHSLMGGGGANTSGDCYLYLNGTSTQRSRAVVEGGHWYSHNMTETFALTAGDVLQAQCTRDGMTNAYHGGPQWSGLELHYKGSF